MAAEEWLVVPIKYLILYYQLKINLQSQFSNQYKSYWEGYQVNPNVSILGFKDVEFSVVTGCNGKQVELDWNLDMAWTQKFQSLQK